MKVLNKENQKECKCGSLLEYEYEDIDNEGCITCPCCGRQIEVRNEGEIIFPNDYYHFNGIDISKDRINNYVKDGIKKLKEQKDRDYWFIGTGNTMIFIFRNDGDEEFNIYVCKNYHEGYIKY